MAEYHVSSGAFGIYAGTVNPKRKDGLQTWKTKTDVTDEAIIAVRDYMKLQAKCEKSNYYSYIWEKENGEKLILSLEIKNEK